ncbi:MAG: hypothetical protein HXS48_14040 [Theionarchaea archaeon]|nr:hypothetical protein [Theionarchaea archaeon]
MKADVADGPLGKGQRRPEVRDYSYCYHVLSSSPALVSFVNITSFKKKRE